MYVIISTYLVFLYIKQTKMIILCIFVWKKQRHTGVKKLIPGIPDKQIQIIFFLLSFLQGQLRKY